ncbi:MAG TPA: response regulator, partial [Geothrix sp.]|nr:response regulator [Geothrix sp.]
QPARLIGTHSDLTDRRTAEAALRDAHKAESLGLMAAGIAHDFNNLFQSLLGNLELAHLRADLPGRQVIDRARNALDKASGLSRRLLDFSGGSFTRLETLSVNALIRGALEASSPRETALIHLELDAGIPEVVADSQQMRQVVEILLENALEALAASGAPEGTVTLATAWLPELPDSERALGRWMGETAPGPMVRISVADTGGGAGPGVMERLFDPFFSTKGLGRGLGLPSALGLIRGNRAALQVVDQPGAGMSFRVYLPADRRVSRRTHSDPEIQADRQAVLVVDDELELRLVLTEALRECHGCEVFEAADGIEAIEVFQAHLEEIGLVLMDSVMPRMKGPEAFDEIRRIRPGVPGILISGFSEGKGQDLAQKHGFSAFLKKPFPLKHLIEVMTEVKALGRTDDEPGGTYA